MLDIRRYVSDDISKDNLRKNIVLSFRATSLVVNDLQAILLKLRALRLSPLGPTTAAIKTKQSLVNRGLTALILKIVSSYKDLTPYSIIEMVLYIKNRLTLKVHASTSLRPRVTSLQLAYKADLELKSVRRSRSIKYGPYFREKQME